MSAVGIRINMSIGKWSWHKKSSAKLFTINPTWTFLRVNPGLSGDRPVTNHLSHGTVCDEVSRKLCRGMENSRITLLFIHTKNLINSKFLTWFTFTCHVIHYCNGIHVLNATCFDTNNINWVENAINNQYTTTPKLNSSHQLCNTSSLFTDNKSITTSPSPFSINIKSSW